MVIRQTIYLVNLKSWEQKFGFGVFQVVRCRKVFRISEDKRNVANQAAYQESVD